MREGFRNTGRPLCAFAGLVLVLGCGGEAPQETTVAEKPKGPDYQVFAPLPRATTKADLPFLVGAESEDISCFKKVEGLEPDEGDVVAKDLAEKHAAEIEKAIRDWVIADLSPTGVTETIVRKWDIKVEDVVVLEVPADKIRFTENPACIEKDVGWLAPGVHAAVALFGAKTIKVKSSLPLNSEIQQELLRAAGMENMVVESEALFVYEQAKDANGEPMKNPDGEALYTSPSGEFITEKEVPPPEKRLMSEFVIKSEKPLFFGFREISNDAWRKESKKDLCDVFLIWDDLTPRPPDCPEFRETAFSATKGTDKDVALTMTTAGENKGIQVNFDETEVVLVNDRVMLWVNPQKLEEGAKIRVNSLVLNPRPLAAEGEAAPEETFRTPAVSEPASDTKGKKDKGKKDKGKTDKKDKTDKGKKGTDTSLDDYLNE